MRGGFAAYGFSYYDIGHEAGEKAVEILKDGKKAGDIPVTPPQNLKLVINEKAAKEMGVKIKEEWKKQYVTEPSENGDCCRDLDRRIRSGRRPPCRPRRGRLHLHLGQGHAASSKTLLPAVSEGAEKAGRSVESIERMIEVKVSYDADRNQALRDCGIGAALALPGETKMGVDYPREMERLGVGAAARAGRDPLARLRGHRRAHRADPAVHRAGLHPPGVPRAGQQPVAVHQRLRQGHLPRFRERWG